MLKESRVDFVPRTGEVRNPPRQIFLELTSRCNLKCVTCPVDYGARFPRDGDDMPFTLIEKLKPWLDAADGVNLNVVGEPLLYPRFGDVIDLLSPKVANLHFNTNGLGLDHDCCENLVKKSVASVVISVDGIESNEAHPGSALRGDS